MDAGLNIGRGNDVNDISKQSVKRDSVDFLGRVSKNSSFAEGSR